MTYDMLSIPGESLGKLILLVSEGKVGRNNGKKVLEALFENDAIDPAAYAEEQGLVMSNDTGKIEAVVKAAIAENPKAVEDFKNGKEKALMALFGRCMKELKGNCAPDTLKEILIAAINSL